MDKVSKIRSQTEEIIIIVMGFIGFQAFMNGTMDLKPAVKQTVTPILQKAKNQCASAGGTEETKEVKEVVAPRPITAKEKLNSSMSGPAKPERPVTAAEKVVDKPKIEMAADKKPENPVAGKLAFKPEPVRPMTAKVGKDEDAF
jgi:hypothetical protein